MLLDAAALTALMHAASAYRGHYASILEGYAITPEQIAADLFHVAEKEGVLLGFYSLTLVPEPELDLLFVSDHAQGAGLGAALFRHMAGEAKRLGLAAVKIISHPPSAGFYETMGATVIGTKPPTPKARWARPILCFRP